jgi:hypothetical protein
MIIRCAATTYRDSFKTVLYNHHVFIDATFGGQMPAVKNRGKIHDRLYWWLGKKQPFIINDEYKLELLFLDKKNNSAKILVTNLKNQNVTSLNAEIMDTEDESQEEN